MSAYPIKIARPLYTDPHRHVPRADRMRVAEAVTNSRSPDLVRFNDELRMPYGTFKVCRVSLNPKVLGGLEYICTDGAQTRTVNATEVWATHHYRDGKQVSLSRRQYRDAPL